MNLQLCAPAIGARDEHVLRTFFLEERTEPPMPQEPRTASGAVVRLDALTTRRRRRLISNTPRRGKGDEAAEVGHSYARTETGPGER